MPIEAKQLSHTYMPNSPFTSTAIEDISFSVKDGEFIGIIGHTGSGKSTLVQHLNALLKPTKGTIVVDGLDIFAKETNLKTVRQKVGLVFQYPEYQLFEETVFKDVAFGPRNLKLPEEEVTKRVKDALAQVEMDYDTYKDLSPFEMSGGQKRRLAIAGVLAMNPGVLILDEPTAGLDPRTRERILHMVQKWHESGKTIFMISHSMEDVAKYADRIFVLNHGKLVMQDTAKNVFAKLDQLKEMNLGVPQVTHLCYALKEAGFPIDETLYTMDEMEETLFRLLKGENGHA